MFIVKSLGLLLTGMSIACGNIWMFIAGFALYSVAEAGKDK